MRHFSFAIESANTHSEVIFPCQTIYITFDYDKLFECKITKKIRIDQILD